MSLKVFDLQCVSGHVFEGWFASHEDYDQQLVRGLLTCPICDDRNITKMLSAPRLNVAHIRQDARQDTRDGMRQEARQETCEQTRRESFATAGRVAAQPTREAAQVAKLQAALMRHVRQVINSAENVGPRFAQEARLIHERGEDRAIRGTATHAERRELAEEGIDVMSVPDLFDDDRLQ